MPKKILSEFVEDDDVYPEGMNEASVLATEPEQVPAYAQYTGDKTQYIHGIPMRDVTREEWDALNAELKHKALESGLYEVLE